MIARLVLGALLMIAARAVDRPMVLQSGTTNAYTLWIDGKIYSPGTAIPNLPALVACRHMADGKWSRIYPLLIVNHTNYVTGEVAEEKSFGLPIARIGKVRVEVAANRLGSQLDPVLRLLEGKSEIAFNDDHPFLGRDSLIEARTKSAAVMELRDVGNGGGANHFFVLSTSDQPLVPLLLPSTNYFESQVYTQRFDARANQKLIFTVETRRFGSPADAGLSIHQTNGAVIAESTGAEEAGPSITNRFDKAGTFELRVRELSKQRGLPFWLRIEEATPGVALSVESERIDLPKGGEAKLKISCRRFDFDGPVSLKVDGVPNGVQILDAVIPEKKNDVELRLKASDAEVQSFHIQIFGALESRNFRVSTMPALKKLYPLQMFPLASMDGWIAVNVSR